MKNVLRKKFFKQYQSFIFLIGFILLIISLTYKDYGIMWDEKIFLAVGKYYVINIFDFLRISHHLGVMNLYAIPDITSHLQAHGVFLDIIFSLLILISKISTFQQVHLIRALLTLPVLILTGFVAKKISGSKFIIFPGLFLILTPFFFGLMFVSPIDIPTAWAYAATIFSFVLFIDRGRKSFFAKVLLGFVFALIVTQRLVFIFIPPLSVLTLYLVDRSRGKIDLRKFFIEIMTISVSTFIFMHLVHPFLFSHPVSGLLNMVKASTSYPLYQAAVLFEGKLMYPQNLPWYYLPKMMLITIPLSLTFLFLAGTISFFQERRYIYFFVLSCFYIPIGLVMLLHPLLFDSWRQLLFLSIPFMIIATEGLNFVLNLKNRLIKFLILSLVCVNLVSTIKQMVAIHPYEYIYYNELVGGLPGAFGKYETEFLGLSYKEATEWFIKNINDGKTIYKIKTEGDPLSSTFFFTKNMLLTNNPEDADYVFVFTRWNLDKRYTGKIIHTVERKGVPLLYIKKTKI